MRPSVLSRVMPALWTTMSTPPWRSRRCSTSASGACSAVMSSWSAVPRTRVRGGRELGALRGHVEADHVARRHARAPRRSRRRSRARRPSRARPCRPAARPSPASRRATASPMRDDLPGDVGGAAGEQEAQRRLDVALGARRDAHELRRRAGAQLLGGASARSPRARAGRRRRARRRPRRAGCRARAAGRSARPGGCGRGRTRMRRAAPRRVAIPDASNTTAPSGSVSSARSRASRPASLAARRARSSATQTSAPTALSTRATGSARRPPAAAPSSAGACEDGRARLVAAQRGRAPEAPAGAPRGGPASSRRTADSGRTCGRTVPGYRHR